MSSVWIWGIITVWSAGYRRARGLVPSRLAWILGVDTRIAGRGLAWQCPDGKLTAELAMAGYVMMLAASLQLEFAIRALPELSGTHRARLRAWRGRGLAMVPLPRILGCQFYYWLLNTAGTLARARGCLVATCQGQRPGRAGLSLASQSIQP